MAIIIPFSDPSAHGSIADSVSFRRRFNQVVFQKKPFPKQPNTAGQIAQRQAFRDASDDWYSYDAQSKLYFIERAKNYNWTARNLFLHAKLTGIMPSQTAIEIKEITAGQLINVRGTEPEQIYWEIFNVPETVKFGHIFDFENIFFSSGPAVENKKIMLEIYMNTGPAVQYLFRDGLAITVKFIDTTTKNLIVRIPASYISEETEYFFIADDGSTYYDQDLIHLAATNNF